MPLSASLARWAEVQDGTALVAGESQGRFPRSGVWAGSCVGATEVLEFVCKEPGSLAGSLRARAPDEGRIMGNRRRRQVTGQVDERCATESLKVEQTSRQGLVGPESSSGCMFGCPRAVSGLPGATRCDEAVDGSSQGQEGKVRQK